MAVTTGGRILAAEYNSLQSRIERLLGNGTTSFGYGQPVTSSPVSIGRTVTAAKLAEVRDDLETAYTLQTGDPIPLSLIEAGDLIAAEQTGGDTTKGFRDYLDLMTTLETNRFNFDASQVEIVPAIASDSRTNSWSRVTITSEVELSFLSSNSRRHFFNSGGQVRLSGVVSNLASGSASYQRNLGWKQLIENPGIVLFDRNSVNVTNTGSLNIQFPQTNNYGNDQVNQNYTEIFRKNASGAVYSNSYWTVEVRAPSSSTLRFRIRLFDGGPESDSDGIARGSVYGGVNEPVTADITMRYGGRRADGSVTVAFPPYSIVNSFQ
jgi:hypothetical protein